MAEELTEYERALLESLYIPGADAPGHKALRIIDAHAADRAALVARVAELERELKRVSGMLEHESELHMRALDLVVPHTHLTDAASKLDSERLHADRAALVARVAELERQQTELRTKVKTPEEAAVAESECKECGGDGLDGYMPPCMKCSGSGTVGRSTADRAALMARVEAAETRVAELEAERDEDYYG